MKINSVHFFYSWQITIQEVNFLNGYCCGDHKRTWQEVPDVLLSYLYYGYMVYANNK